MTFKVPADIAKAAIAAGCTKCSTTTQKLLVLGFLAGAYIAFGALLSEIVAGGLSNGTITAADGAIWKIALPAGLVKLAAGAVFPVGLMLVVIAGSELFTGNCMFAPISVLNGEASLKGLLKNWSIVYLGNFLGSIFVAYFLAYQCGFFDNVPWASWAATVANTKCGLDFSTAFLRGIGCNWLVCLAVWLAISCGRRDRQDLRLLVPDHGLRDHRLRAQRCQHVLHPPGYLCRQQSSYCRKTCHSQCGHSKPCRRCRMVQLLHHQPHTGDTRQHRGGGALRSRTLLVRLSPRASMRDEF